MSVILFVNHRQENCGVQQFGKRLFSPCLKSEKYKCYYIDVPNNAEYEYWRDELKPQLIVYNYYTNATMPWLTSAIIDQQRSAYKQACIFHEVPLDHMGFEYLLHQDPTNTNTKFLNLSRPIPDYRPVKWECEVPVFGSFGFGLGGKGFTRLIDIVKQQFEKAVIRINIPFAAFGDSDGTGARNWAHSCREHLGNSSIILKVTHEMFPENDLLDWLAQNTCNCFFYDINHGRGISGTLDYALAAGKPVAITRSEQFKHWWQLDDSCLIESHSLSDIIALKGQNLEVFHQKWNNKQLLADFEAIFDRILGV